MTLSRLVLQSMRRNLKQYYLYFFALIFSVILCFSFTTLQYSPSVIEALENSGTRTAGFKTATYLLYFIITFFVLYANHLFLKRRSKEIGLYQLVGMTKSLVARLIALENILLFFSAITIGILIGFLSSRFFAMILMKLLEVDLIIELTFSKEAFIQTVITFTLLLVVVLVQMKLIIHRSSLLILFSATKQADERVKPFSIFKMLVGAVGILLIIYGYYQSTLLFNVESKNAMSNLFLQMIIILGSTILGTFLFFRYSVSFIMNILRSRKKGHLKITDVLAVTPIMHRMKGNAKSLTLITVLTGFAVGILTLSYISYVSVESKAKHSSPYDYILLNDQGISFLDKLQQQGIQYEKGYYEIYEVNFNVKDLVSDEFMDSPLVGGEVSTAVVSQSSFQQMYGDTQLDAGEGMLVSYPHYLSMILPLEENKDIKVSLEDKDIPVHITEVREDTVLSNSVNGGTTVLVVEDQLFEEIKETANDKPSIYSQIGINLKDEKDRIKAEGIFEDLSEERKVSLASDREITHTPRSYYEILKDNTATLGLTIFVTAFLGLAFLMTTGSIIYFKQMAEADDERDSYKTLRKIGFSTDDIMKGIYAKQAFNFGVPLVIGLLHSYFAVKSGWFLFGTELVAPVVITMLLYVAMYTVFAVLSIRYYKSIVKSAL